MAANLAKSADPLDMKNAVEIPLTDEATAAAEQKAQQQQQQKRQINWKFWEALNWEPLKTPRSVLKGGQVVSDNDLYKCVCVSVGVRVLDAARLH